MIKDIQVCSITFTEKCNLACKYCYVVEENVGFHKEKEKVITKEILDQTIKFIINNIALTCKTLRIDLYGGECLLYPEELKYFIENFFIQGKNLNNHIDMKIFTNGTTLTEDMLKWTYQYYPKLDYSFSVDGPECTQNLTRVFKDGSGSHDKVLENFELYKNIYNVNLNDEWNEFVYNRSVFTLSPDNISYFIEALQEFKRLGVKRYHTFLCKDDIWSEEDIKLYKKVRKESTELLIEEFPKTGMMDQHLIQLISRFRYKFPNQSNPGHCSSGKQLMSITQDGDIYPCHRLYQGSRAEQFKIGNIWDGIDSNHPYYATLSNRLLKHFKECKNCKYKMIEYCDGPCTSACFESTGSVFKIIPSVCELLYIDYISTNKLYFKFKDDEKFNNLFRKF